MLYVITSTYKKPATARMAMAAVVAAGSEVEARRLASAKADAQGVARAGPDYTNTLAFACRPAPLGDVLLVHAAAVPEPTDDTDHDEE